jgi:hypothetical protein
MDSSSSTSSTHHVISDEWAVRSLLIPRIVLFLTTGGTSGGETAHSPEITRWVVLVEEELPTPQE